MRLPNRVTKGTMRTYVKLVCLLLALTTSSFCQTLNTRPDNSIPAPVAPAQKPNAEEHYQQLRNAGLSNESISVTNAVLKRDAGTFTFNSGAFFFVTPVNGKVTGAVFMGKGHFVLTPPTFQERRT